MPLRLRSKVFEAFHEIPKRYTAEGENLSPPLKWSGVPEGTREFVLMCEDPDAPTPKPFLHWLVYHLSANTTYLPEAIPPQERIEYPVLARQGLNSNLTTGYTGPKPPVWHGPHHYYFKLYALDSELSVPPNAGREEVLQAMQGHVLEEAQLVGYYERESHKRSRERIEAWGGFKPVLTWSLAAMLGTTALAFVLTKVSQRGARRGAGALPQRTA